MKDEERDKDRFFFWRSYWEAIAKLETDEERGMFVRAMCEYAFEDVEPDFGDNAMLDFAWTMISRQVRESVRMGRRASESGKTGGRGHRKGAGKRDEKRHPLSDRERVPESVRYSNVPDEDVAYGEPTAPSSSNTVADALEHAMRYGFPEPPPE